mmetsp:Transcript_48042/g.104498  ORF Transcript_48042/g.104498 Transcript_48042/m.104498 type:complete len:412 (+) Transcript_48042:123-1358(+)
MALKMIFLLPAVCSAVLGFRKHSNADDMNTGEDVWIPFSLEAGHVQYFNPMRGNVSNSVPKGARSTKHIASLVESLHKEGVAMECMPKCGWQCGTPKCNQNCKPKCNQPVCQTRCAKPDVNNCHVSCGDHPTCSVVCPPGAETPVCAEGEQCTDPRCETQCSSPKGCQVICGTGADANCHNDCAPPKCEWECIKPQENECPKPDCKMVCEPNPKCKPSRASYTLPRLPDNHDVVHEFNANPYDGQWQEGSWGSCQCVQGVQYRSVSCSTGNDADCPGPRPSSSQPCMKCTGRRGFNKGSFDGRGSFDPLASVGSSDFDAGLSRSGSGLSSSSGSSDFEGSRGRRTRRRSRREEEDEDDVDDPRPRGFPSSATVWLWVGILVLLCAVVAVVIWGTRKSRTQAARQEGEAARF